MPFAKDGLTISKPSGKVNPNLAAVNQDAPLSRRIPCWPYADPIGRHIVGYDDYVKTGGDVGLRKALTL